MLISFFKSPRWLIFQHLELVDLAEFGREHFAQAFAHRGLPVLDRRRVAAERRDETGREVIRENAAGGE
jgi:hypothetical protein